MGTDWEIMGKPSEEGDFGGFTKNYVVDGLWLVVKHETHWDLMGF